MMLASIVFAALLTPDGLKIDDAKVGTGSEVKPFDVVDVQYIGTLTDGKEFDSSKKPFRVVVGIGMVIKGWDQGLLGMKTGGERNLTIPPELAYGAQAVGKIPANSTLKFNVKLARILPPSKIEVVKEGKGEGLKVGQTLNCMIRMTLPDGKEVFHPEGVVPLRITPQLFPGLIQALAGTKEGETRRVTVSWELAYGEKGFPEKDVTGGAKAGSQVPPKTDVILEIQALKIEV